jgi:hypothetical protein
MKKYIIILLALVTFSCTDELELKPVSYLNALGYWESEEAVVAAHSGIHSSLRARHSTIWGLNELRSDMWGGNTTASPSSEYIIENDISVEKIAWDKWGGFYGGVIHRCNDFIANAPNVSFLNQDKKNEIIGGVYGIRALVYFTMLKSWGGVPISLDPITSIKPEEAPRPRASQEEILKIIKDDIEKSLEYFGDAMNYFNSNTDRVYWTRNASLALKAEVNLWSGNLMGGGNADFTIAKNALLAIKDCDLLTNFSDVFAEDVNSSNNEVIFSFKYGEADDKKEHFYGSMMMSDPYAGTVYIQNGEIVLDHYETVGGISRYGLSNKVLSIINDSLDSRRDVNVSVVYSSEPSSRLIDTTINVATIIEKFMGHVEEGDRKFYNDIPLYRYADVVLMLAEAKNLLGEDPTEEIEKIRKRAYGSNYDQAIHGFTSGTQDENTEAILKERLKEFVAEGKRWSDLRRAGNKFVFKHIKYLNTGDDYKLLLPISKLVLGSNPELRQTPGYEESDE